MEAWEYKVIVLPSSYEMDEEVLNLHGEKAWELVSVLSDSKANRVAYLRRGLRKETDLDATMNQLNE
jgi:hypothetical protein